MPKNFAQKVIWAIAQVQSISMNRKSFAPLPSLSSRAPNPGGSLYGTPSASGGLTNSPGSPNSGAPPMRQSDRPSRPTSQSRSASGTRSLRRPSSPSMPPLIKRYVFLVVGCGSSLGALHHLAQKDVQPIETAEFFKWLREQYFNVIGLRRSWLSIRIFSHCEFYRVSLSTIIAN